MDTQHTPGPWTIRPYNFDNVRGAHGVFPEGRRIPICHSIMGGDLEEADANAALIAAAPELLAALRAAEVWAEHIEDDESRVPVDVRLAMRAAIAKAQGGAP